MSPPELTGNAPVAHIFHPHPVHVFEFGRVELDNIVHDRRECRLGDFIHLEEPLHRELRLDHGITSFGVAHIGAVLVDFLQVACLVQ